VIDEAARNYCTLRGVAMQGRILPMRGRSCICCGAFAAELNEKLQDSCKVESLHDPGT
jgi:hypothetical protein